MNASIKKYAAYAVAVFTVWAVIMLVLTPGPAQASDPDKVQPCDTNSAVKAIRCLSHEKGLHVNTHEALRIAKCESGVGKAPVTASQYQGVYQLLASEFKSFQHQGPHWVVKWIKERHYNINDSWANVAATFAHVHRYGWGFIGDCA